MGTNNKLVYRWPFVVGYLGIVISMLACMAFGVEIGSTSTKAEAGTIQLDNGIVVVVDENGNDIPVAGTSTFELVAPLEGTAPWMVAGRTIATNDSTQIEEGLQVGDLVRIRGTILEDGTWLAYSIEPTEEQVDPIIILIGRVDSVDPWVVNGITLNVTADTIITGDITPGVLVRVEILLLEDGTWEVLSITPLSDVTETEGCVSVTATVISVTDAEIQLLGWPSMPLTSEVSIENEEGQTGIVLSPNQPVLVVLCPTDGQIVIVQIIVIVVTPPEEGEAPPPDEGGKVLVCHKPDKNAHTLSLPQSAIPAHLGHGDILGPCP